MGEHDYSRTAGWHDLDLVDLDLRAFRDALEIAHGRAWRQRRARHMTLEAQQIAGRTDARIRVHHRENLILVALRQALNRLAYWLLRSYVVADYWHDVISSALFFGLADLPLGTRSRNHIGTKTTRFL